MFRKWWFWLLIGIVLFIGFVIFVSLVLLFSTRGTSSGFTERTFDGYASDKIVVTYVDGVIGEDSLLGSSFDSQSFIRQLDQALSDEKVKAIVIRVNSPGGSVVTSDEIYEKILELKNAGIHVVISMGNLAASGGYYISAPADYIFANRATLTGSLGVIFTLPNYQGAAEWIGYQETNITSGEFKDMGNSLRDLRDEEKAIYQSLVDESYERFIDIIAEGRNLTRKETYELADGRVYSGNQALSLGLVDELGSLEDAIAYTKQFVGQEGVRIVQYEQPFSLSDALLGFRSKSSEPLAKAISELLPSSRVEPGLMYLYHP
jgi:protease-4